MADQVERIHDANKEILSVAFELSVLGRALARIGMGDLGEELFGYSQDLINSQEKATNALGEFIHEQFTATQEDSINMLNGMLKVAEHYSNKEKGNNDD